MAKGKPGRIAAALGLKRYQGVPCPHGHAGVRLVAGGHCVDCRKRRRRKGTRAARAAQKRRYYARYPHKRNRRRRSPEAERARRARRKLKYPGLKAAQRKERKLVEAQRVPLWARTTEHRRLIAAVYAEMRATTKATGVPHEVDHIYPLRGKTVSGLHVATNLQVMPAVDNLLKRNRDPLEFMLS